MSDIEVIAAVAAVVSAFHGGSELLKHIKKRRRKSQQAQQQKLEEKLQESLLLGEQQIDAQYIQDMREFGDLIRVGDAIARDQLMHIAVILQAEVIKSLQMAVQFENAILDLGILYESSITNRKQTFVTLDQLKQRLLLRMPMSRPLPGLSDASMTRQSPITLSMARKSTFDPTNYIPSNHNPPAVTLTTQEKTKESKYDLRDYFRDLKRNSGPSEPPPPAQTRHSRTSADINFSLGKEAGQKSHGQQAGNFGHSQTFQSYHDKLPRGNGHSLSSSIKSWLEPSVFDKDDESRGTYPSTAITSQLSRESVKAHLPIQSQELSSRTPPMKFAPQIETNQLVYELSNKDEHSTHDNNFDTQTTYSVDALLDESARTHIQMFTDRLHRDIEQISGPGSFSDIPSSYLEQTLRAFAWQLHAESSSPFHWETSFILHKKHGMILDLLGATSKSPEEGEESDDDDRPKFQKPPEDLQRWIEELDSSNPAPEQEGELATEYPDPAALFELQEHKDFILQSKAYLWLLSRLKQHAIMSTGSKLSELSEVLRGKFKTQHSLRRMSSRRPSPTVQLTLEIDWSPFPFLRAQESPDSFELLIEQILCITGSCQEAQATLAREYMVQKWPITGNATFDVIRDLVSVPEGQEVFSSHEMPKTLQLSARMTNANTCLVLILGAPYAVMEIVEQFGWLSSALYFPSSTEGMLLRHPRIDKLEVSTTTTESFAATIIASCYMGFENCPIPKTSEPTNGFCWSPILGNHVIVNGYPILRRSNSDTGLELSLEVMAYLFRTQQIVQWGERIIMKGFHVLAIATSLTAGAVIWHLIHNASTDKRISYIDPRLDEILIHLSHGSSLRDVEGKRHFVGWCSEAIDYCGHATSNYNISASGLQRQPSSVVIDRLYLEGGASVVGGVSMNINKKEKSFWLQQESDYPRLLKWVGLQPFVFYDVNDRRAWLVDGLSALLHLTRFSLHLDQNDEESPYEWVYDATKLKDNWDGCSGRVSAMKTLRDWDNLRLNVYVKDGSNSNQLQYETFGEIVKRLLHSIEIIVDRQAKVAEQDGMKIFQTLDPRRGIVGFDILDVIAPLGPIDARIQRLDMLGCGWIDLMPPIGATTIFGKGFGELIRPSNPHDLCSLWKTVPVNNDYLATSLSTLRMLYEKKLQRMEPGLGIGEMTSKILWSSPTPPFTNCQCISNTASNNNRHTDPVQFLVSKKMGMRSPLTKRANLVDLVGLGEKGAVVFGHTVIPGRKKGTDTNGVTEAQEDSIVSNISASSGSASTSNLSILDSSTTQSTRSTNVATPLSEGSEDGGGTRVRPRNFWKKFGARKPK